MSVILLPFGNLGLSKFQRYYQNHSFGTLSTQQEQKRFERVLEVWNQVNIFREVWVRRKENVKFISCSFAFFNYQKPSKRKNISLNLVPEVLKYKKNCPLRFLVERYGETWVWVLTSVTFTVFWTLRTIGNPTQRTWRVLLQLETRRQVHFFRLRLWWKEFSPYFRRERVWISERFIIRSLFGKFWRKTQEKVFNLIFMYKYKLSDGAIAGKKTKPAVTEIYEFEVRGGPNKVTLSGTFVLSTFWAQERED